jgi:hypothetical protein
VTCSMQCNAPYVPADLLNELCDMVNSGCIDLLLDGLSLLAWPLAGVAAAFAAPVQPAAQFPALAGPLQAAGELAGTLSVASCRTVSSCAVSGPYHVRYRVEWQQQQQGAALVAGSSTAGAPSAAAAAAHGLVLEMLFACHGRVKVLIRQHDPAAATQQQQQHVPSSPAARQATAAAIRGFMRRFMQQRGARVPLLPAVSTGHYVTVLPEQGSRSGDAVAGCWLQAQHVGIVLQELLQYWQQHVVGKQQQTGAASTAAVKAEVVATPPPQQQQQQGQGQQQQQQQPVAVQQAGQAAVAGQGAAAMPQQQQQQQVQQGHLPIKPEQQQQQQAMMQNNHMPHVVQQPMQHAAAGHVLGGR